MTESHAAAESGQKIQLRRRMTGRDMLLAGAGLAAFAGLLTHGLPPFPAAVFVLLLGWMAKDHLHSVLSEWRPVHDLLRRQLASARSLVEPLYQITPAVKLIEGLLFLLVTAWMLLTVTLGQHAKPYTDAMISISFLIVGILECLQRSIRLMRHTWARTVGKVLLGGIGAVVYVIANVSASQLVADLSHIDPKYVPSFVRLVALAITPAYYIFAIGIMAALWSILEILSLAVLLAAFEFKKFIQSNVDAYKQAVAPREEKYIVTEKKDRVTKALLLNISRSFIFCGFIACILVMGTSVKYRSSTIDGFLRMVLVATDYRELPLCNTSEIALQISLDEGRYSIAKPAKNDATFTIKICPTSKHND